MSQARALPRLLLVTDRRAAGGQLVEVIAAAVAAAPLAGVLVQVREKDLDARPLAELTRAVIAVARPRSCPVVVNDRVDVAVAVNADGVHLPEAGMGVAVARSLLGAQAIVGASTHDPRAAAAAGTAGADYVVCGPVWDTPSKRGMGSPIGTDALALAARDAACPVFAIGGITDPARARTARACGAHGVALIRAVMATADPGASVAALCRALAA